MIADPEKYDPLTADEITYRDRPLSALSREELLDAAVDISNTAADLARQWQQHDDHMHRLIMRALPLGVVATTALLYAAVVIGYATVHPGPIGHLPAATAIAALGAAGLAWATAKRIMRQ